MNGDMKEEYRRHIIRKFLFIVVCMAAIVLVVGLSCNIGQDLSLAETYSLIYNHIIGVTYLERSPIWWQDYFIWNSVMPRLAVAVIAGASLALGGTVMQSMMANPLAEPYTTGIASGACFGAVAAIVAGVSFSTIAGQYGIVTNAFLFSLIPAFMIIAISRYVDATPATLVLVGTAISYFFNAMVTMLMVTTDADTLQAAYLWQVGSLVGVTWSDVPLMLTVTAVCSVFVLYTARNLNLMILGDNSAKSLGLNAGQYRIMCMLMLSVMVASIISFTGIIGFVGLVSPHVVRMIIGSDNRFVAPASMVAGALMLLVADLLARSVSVTSEIPVGVVMAFIGSPIFLMLILFQKKGYGEVY